MAQRNLSKYTPDERKAIIDQKIARVEKYIADGLPLKKACAMVGRSYTWWQKIRSDKANG